MGLLPVLIFKEFSEKEIEEYKQKFYSVPAGVVDGVPVEFLRRVKASTTHPGCYVFCMWNGEEPDVYNERTNSDARPTFKGLQPKTVSFLGKRVGAPFVPGQIVTQTCGFRYCVSQQHLVDGGLTNNQYTR